MGAELQTPGTTLGWWTVCKVGVLSRYKLPNPNGLQGTALKAGRARNGKCEGKLLNPGVQVQLSYKARRERSVMDECEGLDSSSSEATQGKPRTNHHTRGL